MMMKKVAIILFCLMASMNGMAQTKKAITLNDVIPGGTNFRSCLVTFDDAGLPVISEMEKTKMPGIEKELNKKDFFDQIAANLEHLKNKSDRIGFCFSYPMEIQENGDGILLGFSKEVKAPEVVGSKVGEELKKALSARGWNTINRITLCNDTVAALLAGAACAGSGNNYSSYIGYILGTGMNAAYIQPECSCCGIKKQIIVCESGKFKGVNRSDFDIEFDKTTVSPGTFFMEKLLILFFQAVRIIIPVILLSGSSCIFHVECKIYKQIFKG